MLLTGAKPVPLATNMIGLSESSRRKNVPSGPSKRRISLSFMLGEYMLGERAAAIVAHMQLQQFVVMGRVGQRKAPALAIFHENIDILPSEKLQAVRWREASGK